MSVNPWILLAAAGGFEIIWAVAMKSSDGFTRTVPSIVTGLAAFISFWLLAAAMKDLPLGTAYAVWTGIGAVGAALFGILIFGDEATPLRISGIVIILVGIAALKSAG